MNIVFVSPECFPFAKESSLGDLVFSLSKGIEREKHNVKIFMPRYGSIDPIVSHIERIPIEFKVKFNGVLIPTYVYKGIVPNSMVNVFFLESQNYFSNSKEIYLQESHDEERFSFFSLATLEAISKLKLEATIIHLFNPKTAYIAKLLSSKNIEYAQLNKIPTIFTIHNLQEANENLMSITKEAINLSDFITCMSKTYASELLSDIHNCRLKESLSKKEDCFCGIFSGIDEDIYNPEINNDNSINQTYSKDYFSIGKRKCKEDLLELAGLEKNLQTPLFGIILDLTNKEGFQLLINTIDELSYLNLQLVILTKSKELYEEALIQATNKYKNIKALIVCNYNLSTKIYAGSDFFINLNKHESSGASIQIAMKYGSIPVAYEIGAVKEIVINVELGKEANGITFKKHNKEDLIEAISKATQLYKNKEKWTGLVKQAMSFSINSESIAKEYIKCYERILEKKIV